MLEKELQNQIATQLTQAGFRFEQEQNIGGLRLDFVVYGPNDAMVIVEVRAWDPRGGNTARALKQVEHYKEVTGADGAFLVMDAQRTFVERGVINPEQLMTSLQGIFKKFRRQRSSRKPILQPSDRIIFAAMPFDREYDDTFFVSMSYAAEQVNAACKRVDRTEFSGDIVEEIKQLIHSSIAVIVDLSEAKPNVLYEAGYAHALCKPAVHICSTALSELPFDVRNWNTLSYNRGQTSGLREPLSIRLQAALQ